MNTIELTDSETEILSTLSDENGIYGDWIPPFAIDGPTTTQPRIQANGNMNDVENFGDIDDEEEEEEEEKVRNMAILKSKNNVADLNLDNNPLIEEAQLLSTKSGIELNSTNNDQQNHDENNIEMEWLNNPEICWPVDQRDPQVTYYSIEDLPIVLMDKILGYLNPNDIIRLSLLNRLWHQYTTANERWAKTMGYDSLSLSFYRLKRMGKVPKDIEDCIAYEKSPAIHSNKISIRNEAIKCAKSATVISVYKEHMREYELLHDTTPFEKDKEYESPIMFVLGYSIIVILLIMSLCLPFIMSHSNPQTDYWWLFAYIPLGILNLGYVLVILIECIYQRYNPILTIKELKHPEDKAYLLNLKTMLIWVSYLIVIMLIKMAFLQNYAIWKYLVIPGTLLMIYLFLTVWLKFGSLIASEYTDRKHVVVGFFSVSFCVFSMFAVCCLSIHLGASKLDGDAWISWCPWTVIFCCVYYVTFVFIVGTPTCMIIFLHDELSSCFYFSILYLLSILIFGLLFSPFYLTSILLGVALDGWMDVHYSVVFIPFWSCCCWMPIFLTTILYLKKK